MSLPGKISYLIDWIDSRYLVKLSIHTPKILIRFNLMKNGLSHWHLSGAMGRHNFIVGNDTAHASGRELLSIIFC
jgi:hypothetical protein